MTDPVKKLAAVLDALQNSKDVCFQALRKDVEELAVEQRALRTDVSALAAKVAIIREELALWRKSGR